MKYVKRTILVVVILIAFTIINFFVIRGHYRVVFLSNGQEHRSVYVSMDRDDILEIEDISFTKNNDCCIEVKAIQPGTVTLTAHYGSEDENKEENEIPEDQIKLYVHPSRIIYEKDYIGSVGNLRIVLYETTLIFLIATINLIISVKKNLRINMYSYRIMYYAGALVFSGINLICWIATLFTSNHLWSDRLYSIYTGITGICTRIPIILIPLVLAFSVLLSVSNIVLIKKEGFRFRNMLGIGLGLVLIIMTVFPIILYPLMDSVANLHSYLHSYLGYHIEYFLETVFFSVLSYLECMLIGTMFGIIVAQRHVPDFKQDYIIILGSGLRPDGTVTPLLKNRADRAVWFANRQKEKTGKDLYYVCSGGQGEDEVIPEAQAIKNYLLSCGIEEDCILTEEKSRSTYENMKFSKEIIDNHAKWIKIQEKEETASDSESHIAFSTTDYHVFRSGRFAYKLGMNAYGVGARTKWYFYLNAQIREFVANMKAQQKRHFMNVLFIILLIAFLFTISFRFNIM